MSKTAEQPRHFLEVADLSPKELHWVLEKALKIRKRVDENRLKTRDELHGRSIAFLTSKESLRTRGSIHQAASLLGGEAVTFGKDSLYDEKSQPREPVGHMVRCLEEQGYPIIAARLHKHEQVEEMAGAAKRAHIINALTDKHHPLQALADLEGFLVHRPKVKHPTIAYMGDGNNVATSLAQATVMMGWNFVHSGPEERQIDDREWGKIQDLARRNGGTAEYNKEPMMAVSRANMVYTDVWASMGEKDQATERAKIMQPYQITAAMMRNAQPDAILGHCLPAEAGREVTQEVLDHPEWSDPLWTIAGARMDTTAALMRLLLKKR